MKYNIIYVAGYGRSGSTLLDRILNTSDEVFASGEIVHVLDTVTGKYISVCGCGVPQTECEFWSDILVEMKSFVNSNGGEDYIDNLFRKIEGVNGLFFRPSYKELSVYLEYNKLLFDLIYSKTRVRYIVDSSKTAWMHYKRPIYLKKIYSDLKVIHLQRKAPATAYSNIRDYYGVDYRKSKKREIIYLKSLISWRFSNKMAFRLYHPENYLFIEYENFILNLNEWIDKINSFLKLDKKINISRINEGNHIYTGNASRLKKIENLKVDDEYEKNINLLEKVLGKLAYLWLRQE